MRFESMWSALRRYGPFAAVVGYIAMYYSTSKGLASIIPDLQAISIAKLSAKWQNFAMAIAALIVISILPKLRIPASLRTVLTLVLYAIAGWQIATAIDPPGGIRTANVSVPRSYNPYFAQVRGA